MSHEFRASLVLRLPDDPGEKATAAAIALQKWAAFSTSLPPEATHEFSIVETRSRKSNVAATDGAKRSKDKVPATRPPGLVLTNEDMRV